MVEDLYCPNPDCDGNEVIFLFCAESINGVLVPEFRVQWPFSGAIKDIENLSNNFTRKQIRSIFETASLHRC